MSSKIESILKWVERELSICLMDKNFYASVYSLFKNLLLFKKCVQVIIINLVLNIVSFDFI